MKYFKINNWGVYYDTFTLLFLGCNYNLRIFDEKRQKNDKKVGCFIKILLQRSGTILFTLFGVCKVY